MNPAPIIDVTVTSRVTHPGQPRYAYATPCVAVRRGGRVVDRWLLTLKGKWVRSAFIAVVTLLMCAPTVHAMTPEQENQQARRRMAEACQNLIMSGLVETCNLNSMGVK